MTTLTAVGAGRRIACLAYEALLLTAMLLAASAIVTAIQAATGPGAWLIWLARLLFTAVLGTYFCLSWMRDGQTVAMKAWRIRLVANQGDTLTWQHALMRFMVAMVLVTGLPVIAYASLDHGTRGALLATIPWGLLTFIAAVIDPQGRSLHDRLCGTRLVLLDKPARTAARS